MIDAIANEIRIELDHPLRISVADTLRVAAMVSIEEHEATVADFVAAAGREGVNAGTARNRWHEARKAMQ